MVELRHLRYFIAVAEELNFSDIALSLCPEIAADLERVPVRHERFVALLPEAHALAGEDAIPLSVRHESFHTEWDLGVLAEIPAAAVAPETVAHSTFAAVR